MSSTIASELQLLRETKADIADALESKHAVVPEHFADYGNAIRNIPQNEAPNISNPVKFVDYDGTLLYSYGVDATLALEALPDLPERPGLTNQGWNYTLAQLKTQVQTIGKAIVGCNYITDDGKTRIYITITYPEYSLIKVGLAQTASNSYTINWGDGSAEDGPYGSTGYTQRSHQYSPASYPASYVIEISKVGDGYPYLNGPIQGSASTGTPSQNNNTTQTTALGSMIKKIELGTIHSTIGAHSLHWLTTIKTVNIPNNVTNLSNQCLGGLDAAKGLVIPSSVTTVGTNLFAYCYATEMISLPPTISSITTSMFFNCNALMELVIPYSVTSIGDQAFSGCGAMQDLKFPSSITAIPTKAFYNCMAMPRAEFLGNITTMGDSAFFGCNSLQEFKIPSTTANIPYQAFKSSNTIQKIVFEGNIESIGAEAFYACYGIREYDFTNCTAVPTLSNVNAFQNTYSKKKIIVPDALYTDWIAAGNWSSSTNNIVTSIVKESEA